MVSTCTSSPVESTVGRLVRLAYICRALFPASSASASTLLACFSRSREIFLAWLYLKNPQGSSYVTVFLVELNLAITESGEAKKLKITSHKIQSIQRAVLVLWTALKSGNKSNFLLLTHFWLSSSMSIAVWFSPARVFSSSWYASVEVSLAALAVRTISSASFLCLDKMTKEK